MSETAARRANKVIGFKAFHDSDADILQWWNDMPEGQRSVALRALIRAQLGLIAPRTRSEPPTSEALTLVREDTAWLRLALSDLPSYLERVIQQVAVQVPVAPRALDTPSPLELPQLSAEQAARRKSNMARTSW